MKQSLVQVCSILKQLTNKNKHELICAMLFGFVSFVAAVEYHFPDVLSKQQHNYLYQQSPTIQINCLRMSKIEIIFAFLLLIFAGAASGFDITKSGKDGTILYQTACNPFTTLQFQFSSATTLSAGAATKPSQSKMFFLDVYGIDLNLTLEGASYEAITDFVTGYGRNTGSTVTPQGAFIFKFASGLNYVYAFLPVTTKTTPNPDLLSTSPASISSFAEGGSLSAFNVLDQTDYNQWYTSTVGQKTVLVSNFVYNIKTPPTAATTYTTQLTGIDWTGAIATTGDKLCYGSTLTTKNFQTHIRQSVPMWFIWFFVLFFWLFYLISDSTNLKIYDKKFENNKLTCISWYSIFHLAHEEYFTRLSRTTGLLINWTLQGVFIASIYGNQLLGSPMIIWTAVVALVATMPFPFFWGQLIFKKICKANEIKYENMKLMKGTIDKEKIEPFETKVDQCQQKLYGYYHWYYAICVVLLFICWPIAINQMQKLPRTYYHYHWYWLASMGVTMALEYLIYEPLLAVLFGNRQIVRNRGGYFYKAKLAQLHRSAQSF